MHQLTAIQARLLGAVRRRVDLGEPGPTYRELCAEFGWSSTGTARDHIKALARKGYLELPGGHRRLRLRDDRAPAARVPLVGCVAAGSPTLSDENVTHEIPVPAEWTRGGTHFAVRVTGDSMRDAGILDGDEVIVRQQASANDGDIVVATLDGETTLKRLRVRGRSMTLVAENPRYNPIEIRTESALIQGVVVGLLRAYKPCGLANQTRRLSVPRRVATLARGRYAHRA